MESIDLPKILIDEDKHYKNDSINKSINSNNDLISLELREEPDSKSIETEIINNNKNETYTLESYVTRYLPINNKDKKLNINKYNYSNNDKDFNSIEFIKKKSRLEKEKDISKSKSNIDKAINYVNKKNQNQNFESLSNYLIKKKSKLELEKEAFKEILRKNKQEELKKITNTNNYDELIIKLDSSLNKNEVINSEITHNNKENINTDNYKNLTEVCNICNSKGSKIKGKVFIKCKHYYHNVSIFNYILILYLIRNAC